MIASRILGVRVLVEYGRPQYRSSPLRQDSSIDTGEIGATAFLDVIQIDIKGKDADSTRTIQLIGNVVVVRLERPSAA